MAKVYNLVYFFHKLQDYGRCSMAIVIGQKFNTLDELLHFVLRIIEDSVGKEEVEYRRNIGDLVRELRERKDMSRKDLAEASDRSVLFLGLLEDGRLTPSLDDLVQLALGLKVLVGDLKIPGGGDVRRLNGLAQAIRIYLLW